MANQNKINLQDELTKQQGEYTDFSRPMVNQGLYGIQQAAGNANGLYNPGNYGQSQNRADYAGNAGQNTLDQMDQQTQALQDQAAQWNQENQPGMQAQDTNAATMDQGAAEQQRQAQALWANPGYTDQEKQAINRGSTEPIAASYAAAQGQNAGAAARTGNSANLGANNAELARQKARDMSLAGTQNQSLFANQRIQGQQFANTAEGQANQSTAQAGATRNQANQNRLNVQQTGANIFGQAQNNRLQSVGARQGQQGVENQTQQTGQAAALAPLQPANTAGNFYGTIQNARNGTLPAQTTLGTQQSTASKILNGIAGVGTSMFSPIKL